MRFEAPAFPVVTTEVFIPLAELAPLQIETMAVAEVVCEPWANTDPAYILQAPLPGEYNTCLTGFEATAPSYKAYPVAVAVMFPTT